MHIPSQTNFHHVRLNQYYDNNKVYGLSCD
jgi:hypothetical protein